MSKKKSEWSSSESDSEKSFSSLSSHSRSQSVNSKSTRQSKDRQTSSRYSDNFSSGSLDTDIKSKKTKTPSFSDTESISSSKSAESEPNSFKNLIQDNEPNGKLPTKVYQILESLKNSLINVYNLKKTFKENTLLIKQYSTQSSELTANNEKISDLMVQECLGCIALSQVVFGSSHWRYAMAYTELALIYLEFKNLPKQSKQYCEIAWKILYEELKNKTLHEANKSENQSNNFASITPQVVNKHQMMLNYIYGRACTLLKENDRGLSILEKAEEFYENWLNDLSELKLKFKYKEEICSWKLKIYFALAK
ncbi:tetratricopeptide repeat 23 isoform X4 [Brachionus plicatilis]|uniref:Tetratricopeptide repeat 23 isoform X4 n=1 Tax=Brachionus plicatilis TaxID=10195 RepID=A0A3M7RTA7_BRAPC|nr:tetratricopeptide repeat 23 isoform X4 [Brachionus plicatilis]